MSKHHVPDDDTLDPTAHRWWLAEISRTDTTVDTPRHLFSGVAAPDVVDGEEVVLATVIPLRLQADDEGAALPVVGTELAPAQPSAGRGGRTVRRPVLVGAAALTCVLTVLLGSRSAQSKHVALVVDGQTQYVDTRADTVDAVLASAGLQVGAHDTLAPAGPSAISDGSKIVLDHGQELTVNSGGQAEQIWTTKAKAAAIQQAAAQGVGAAPAVAASTTAALPTVSTTATVPGPDARVAAGQSVVVTRSGTARTTTRVASSTPAVKVRTTPSVGKTAAPAKASSVVSKTSPVASRGAAAANAALGTVTIKDPNRETTNAQAIYEFFRNNGATAAGAAGITGNFIDESGTNPNAVSDSGFYGIEQWGGSRWEGPDSLTAFAADQGASAYDLHTQLEFSLFELGLRTWTDKSGTTHTPPGWVTPGGAVITDTSITDPAAAAMKFEAAAEGCEPADACGLDVRQLAAQEVYDALKGYVPTGPNAGPSS